jgi:ATP-binding cassette subfamily B protein
VVHEVLSSLRVVKAFGQEESENDRFADRASTAMKGQIKVAWFGAFYSSVVGMLLAIGTALFIYFGAHFVHSGDMTLGELTLVISYLAQVFGPLHSISKNINDIQASLVSIDRVFDILDEEKEVKDHPDAIHIKKAKGAFEFNNVSFGYSKDKPVINNFSFRIYPGDRVGIKGATGAGKSTLISLIYRFYDPGSGTISMDGTDIRKIKLKDYRNQFSIVLQEPVLFATTIEENIRYGRPGATKAEIIEAAKAANAYDFIVNSVNGFDTMVGERGMQLSGGERQRISIARAFIKNSPVLILDEPTSAIDIKTEKLIMEAISRLMVGKTTFMITHRLDTLKTCNVLLHVENGNIEQVQLNNELKADENIPILQ